MEIKIRKLSETAKIPSRGSDEAAGYDLFADIPEPVDILPHTTAMSSTGVAMAIPAGYFGGIFARSGLSAKEGLRPANCTGVVDSDYRGPVKVALHNDGEEVRSVLPQEKTAQLVVIPYLEVTFKETDSLDETGRGAGGFGSTGR